MRRFLSVLAAVCLGATLFIVFRPSPGEVATANPAAKEAGDPRVDPRILALIMARLNEDAAEARKFVAGFNALQVKLHAAPVNRASLKAVGKTTSEDWEQDGIVFESRTAKEAALLQSLKELQRLQAKLRARSAGRVDLKGRRMEGPLAVGRCCNVGYFDKSGIGLLETSHVDSGRPLRELHCRVEGDRPSCAALVDVEPGAAADSDPEDVRLDEGCRDETVYAVVGTRKFTIPNDGTHTVYVLRPIHRSAYEAAIRTALLESAPAASPAVGKAETAVGR